MYYKLQRRASVFTTPMQNTWIFSPSCISVTVSQSFTNQHHMAGDMDTLMSPQGHLPSKTKLRHNYLNWNWEAQGLPVSQEITLEASASCTPGLMWVPLVTNCKWQIKQTWSQFISQNNWSGWQSGVLTGNFRQAQRYRNKGWIIVEIISLWISWFSALLMRKTLTGFSWTIFFTSVCIANNLAYSPRR